MSKTLVSAAVAAAILAISSAFAQTPPPASAPPRVQDQAGDRGGHGHAHGTLARADIAAHVRSMFGRLDRNRDGYLTRAETAEARGDRRDRVKQHIERRGRAQDSLADRRAMFDRMDANHDGAISRDEFARAPLHEEHRVVIRNGEGEDRHVRELGGNRPMRGAVAGLHRHMFDRADANRDGRVSLQEATAEAYRHFDSADVNRDGRISPDERIQMHRRMRAERRSG